MSSPQTPPQQMSGLATPAGTPGRPLPPVVSPVAVTGSPSTSDQLVHLALSQMLPTAGLGSTLGASNMTTGLVSSVSIQPFQYALTLGHNINKSLAPQKHNILERPAIKSFVEKFARVAVKNLEVEIVADATAIGYAFQVTACWLPASMATPAASSNLKCMPGAVTRVFGGMAFASHTMLVPCPFDKGIQPVLKAPLPFANTPAFFVAVHSVKKADGSDPDHAGDYFDVIVRGELEYEGVYVAEW